MTKRYKKILAVVLATVSVLSGAFSIPLQTRADGCTVVSATLSPHTETGSYDKGFYSQAVRANKPVTITVTSTGCENVPLYVSLTEYDVGGTVPNEDVAELNNKKVVSSTGAFRITMLPGEEGCSWSPLADCEYGVRVGLTSGGHDYSGRNFIYGNMDYDCEGICSDKWTYQKFEEIPNPLTNPYTASPDCKIVSATIAPSTEVGSYDGGFYSESTRTSHPVTITVTSDNCQNQNIYVSLTQFDSSGFPTNGNHVDNDNLTTDTYVNPNVDALNRKVFTSPTGSFAITMTPGQELCSAGVSGVSGDCQYGVRVGVTPYSYTWSSRGDPKGNLDYDCDSNLGCSGGSKWQYVSEKTVSAPANVNGNPATVSSLTTPSTDPCAAAGKSCYSVFAGFANALGGKFAQIQDADSLGALINAIIAFGIGVGGVLAVVMIMYQGFLYMKTDSVTTKGSAKSKIVNTVIGFLLLLSIYTILRTINPNLLNLTPGIDASTLTSIPDRAADPTFQQTTTALGGDPDKTDYSDPTFVAYLYHQQGPGGAPSILWAAQKGYSTVPSSTPFISGDATQVNKNMANNVNLSDMQKLIGTSTVTPANFLKYWGMKVQAAKDSTATIDPAVSTAISKAATDTGTDLVTMTAICRIESGCSPTVAKTCNTYGYCGLFQLSSDVFTSYTESGGTIRDPYSNAYAGGKYAQYNDKMYASQKAQITQ